LYEAKPLDFVIARCLPHALLTPLERPQRSPHSVKKGPTRRLEMTILTLSYTGLLSTDAATTALSDTFLRRDPINLSLNTSALPLPTNLQGVASSKRKKQAKIKRQIVAIRKAGVCTRPLFSSI
jgi:hypothetical protein